MIAKTKATAAGSLLPEVLAYTSSLADDLVLLRHDVVGSLAHLAMLEAVALVSRDDAAAIRAELVAIANEATKGTLALPQEEDVHMAVEARLTEQLGERAGLLHTARSRNDQIALDLTLFVREAAVFAVGEIATTIDFLVERARADASVILPAYTHRQRAMPITGGFFWAAHAAAFARDLEAFGHVIAQANVSPLGCGAVAGTSLPIDREHVARSFGFARVSLNAMDTVSNRDFELDFAFASARAAAHVARLASDVVDFSSAEFGFMKLGDAIACGSSMMPQKKNPDLFELLRGKSARLGASVAALAALGTKMPSGYGRELQEDRAPLFDAKKTLLEAHVMLRVGLAHVTFDRARCLAAVDADAMQATDLAEALVAKHAVPFRTAYRAVGALVKLAQELGVPLAKISAAQAASIDPRFDASVLAACDPRTSPARRSSAGGTAPERVEEQLVALANAAAAARTKAGEIPSIAALLEALS